MSRTENDGDETMTGTEYFIHANSFAAPFVSDETTGYVTAQSPGEALERYAENYGHPCGLYAADCYISADDYHKRKPRMARWLSNKAKVIEGAVDVAGTATIYSAGEGIVTINGEPSMIRDPRHGGVVV